MHTPILRSSCAHSRALLGLLDMHLLYQTHRGGSFKTDSYYSHPSEQLGSEQSGSKQFVNEQLVSEQLVREQ